MKLPRYSYLPALLAVYLAFMAYFTYDGVASGEVSLASYIATCVVTLAAIVALFFALKRRDKLRREREEDMKKPRT